MAPLPLTSWTLTIPEGIADALWRHLFGDGDAHGAVILAGRADHPDGPRLIARELLTATVGVDYVEGVHGYRRLAPAFVRAGIIRARDEGLVYLAVHNHGGIGSVRFSNDDESSQRRGYPALLDITRGQPVGAVVIARYAVAGNLWLNATTTIPLRATHLIGAHIRRLYPAPPARDPVASIFDRQTRIFGDAGQALLTRAQVGVLGAGGAGMLIVEYLARLGVGALIVIDPDRVAETNLPRLPAGRRSDIGIPKIELAERIAREANQEIEFRGLALDVTDPIAAAALSGADFLFCAADSMRARLLFNALVQQFGIPGIQLGAKVQSDAATGALLDVRSVMRWVGPRTGCLWCNGLISRAGLADEQLTAAQRAAQCYVDDGDIVAPAVITLNAVAASLAANEFLLRYTGAATAGFGGYATVDHRRARLVIDEPRSDDDCPECGTSPASRFGRGHAVGLPVRATRPA